MYSEDQYDDVFWRIIDVTGFQREIDKLYLQQADGCQSLIYNFSHSLLDVSVILSKLVSLPILCRKFLFYIKRSHLSASVILIMISKELLP